MADWNTELPGPAVAGDEGHVDAHNAIVDAIEEVRTNVDGAEGKAAWSGITGKPTIPPAATVDNLGGATAVGKAVAKAADAAAAREAIGAGTSSQNLSTGTAAALEAGTDTTARAWSAKAIHDEIARQVAAAAG